MASETNKRTPNITAQDKDRLFRIVIRNASTVESKKTDAVSVLEKNQCWEAIADEFNSSSNYKRSAKQLRSCYQNAKSALKKDIASDKIETYKTGGGSFTKKTDENHPLLSIVLKETTPVNNQFDSSSDYFELLPDTFDEEFLEVMNTPPTTGSFQSTENLEVVSPTTSQQSCAGPSQPRASTKKKRTTTEFVQNLLAEFGDLKRAKLQSAAEKNSAKAEYYKAKTEILKKRSSENENAEN